MSLVMKLLWHSLMKKERFSLLLSIGNDDNFLAMSKMSCLPKYVEWCPVVRVSVSCALSPYRFVESDRTPQTQGCERIIEAFLSRLIGEEQHPRL